MTKNVSEGILFEVKNTNGYMTPEDVLDVISEIARHALKGRKISRILCEFAEEKSKDVKA